MYVWPQIVPVLGRIRPCGATQLLLDHVILSIVTHDSWHYNPPPRHTRRVLVIVNLEQVRPLMNAHHCDAMEATTCRELPSLGRLEEYALFTYSFLVHPAQTQTLTVDIMLYYISQHITYTWDCYLEPSSMDLRWQDSTGDTFVLRNGQILIDLLREHRPHWTEGQDQGLLNTIRNFDNPNQPYIMRLSCHEALPNPNMLPCLSSDKMTVLPDSMCPLMYILSCFLYCSAASSFHVFCGSWLKPLP